MLYLFLRHTIYRCFLSSWKARTTTSSHHSYSILIRYLVVLTPRNWCFLSTSHVLNHFTRTQPYGVVLNISSQLKVTPQEVEASGLDPRQSCSKSMVVLTLLLKFILLESRPVLLLQMRSQRSICTSFQPHNLEMRTGFHSISG